MRRIIRRPRSPVEQIEDHATQDREEQTPVDRFFIRTGMTLWNLGLSDQANGGFLAGKIANVVGDSSSGKTFLCLGLLAEAANDDRLDEYTLIHDDPESACEFNILQLFGQKAAERICSPSLDHAEPKHSRTMADLQTNVRRLVKNDRPFIYVLDSLDALTTVEELSRADEIEKANEKGEIAKGTYGMEKAKQASVLLRVLTDELKRTKSLLIIISQTRDNIDPMSFQRKTRAGGKALTFYCSYEMWTAVESKITTEVGERGKKVGVGVVCRMKITKDRCTGKGREISLPIYFNYGPDDLRSCVEFLVTEKVWDKKGGGLIEPGGKFGTPATLEKLIKRLEADDLQDDVRALVGLEWKKQADALRRTGRKPRYGDN